MAIGVLLVLVGLVGPASALDSIGLREPVGRFDAIVVLGCRVNPDGRPSEALRRRTEAAVRYYQRGVAPLVVFTGGVGTHPPSEARSAARYAQSLGLETGAIVREERSTSTEENARFARVAIPDARRVLVVTDAYHVTRSTMVFARYFDAVEGTGTIGSPWPRARGAVREVGALAAYAVLGRL